MKRIVCGVGDEGKNTVLFQDTPPVIGIVEEGLRASSEAAGEHMYLGWAASSLDGSTSDYATDIVQHFNLKLNPGETRFMWIRIAPGAESPMHRTPHINDYLVAVSGELTMRTEDGMSVKFTAGDMLVQLAGWHSWKNEGSEPFVMAGVVVGIETDADVPFGVEKA
jgi:quercetin dioxygenase-like cupin family protein